MEWPLNKNSMSGTHKCLLLIFSTHTSVHTHKVYCENSWQISLQDSSRFIASLSRWNPSACVTNAAHTSRYKTLTLTGNHTYYEALWKHKLSHQLHLLQHWWPRRDPGLLLPELQASRWRGLLSSASHEPVDITGEVPQCNALQLLASSFTQLPPPGETQRAFPSWHRTPGIYRHFPFSSPVVSFSSLETH